MAKQIMKRFGFILIIIFSFISCKTYIIPIESFTKQFKGVDTSNYKIVKTRGPFGEIVEYRANPIDTIKCFDKKNNLVLLKNKPSLEIRFTRKNNKKTVFFFDKVFLQDTLIIGDMSRLIKLQKSIPIGSIKKIEIQDGHKNYKYVQ